MATDKERTYNVPLRREWLKVPIHQRTAKAVKALREFMQKHMKTKEIKLGKYLNLEMWKRGYKNPPHKISVIAKWVEEKDKKYVKVEIVGAPEEKKEEKADKKSKKKETKKDDKKEEKTEKKEDKKDDKKETKKDEKPAKEEKKPDPKKK